MTVTRVRSRWLVAWDGSSHGIVPDGELVFDGDRIVHAGGPWTGTADRTVDASDALVAPGFVDLHVHAGALPSGRAYDDRAGPQAQRLGFLQYAAPAEDAPEDARPLAARPPTRADHAGDSQDLDGQARVTVAELLRGGTTCAVEIGGETGVPPEAMRRAGGDLGLRLVLGLGFRSRDYVVRPDGTVAYRDRPDRGAGAFAAALAYARDLVAAEDPWVGAMLFPLQIDTCSPALLEAAYAAADELGIPMQVHGAQTPFEVEALAAEDGGSPVRRLEAAGALGPRTILAHGILLPHHSWLRDRSEDDLERLAASGAAVAHCPVAMARRGLALESYGRYVEAGVPVAIGTDTYPRDVVAEMRWAVYLSRIADRRAASPTAWDALASVTTVAADRIGRPDLGRLAPGARADVQVVDLERYRTGPVRDPVGTWVHGGVAENVRAVWTGGVERVRDGVVLGADEAGLARRRQRTADTHWARSGAVTSRRRSRALDR